MLINRYVRVSPERRFSKSVFENLNNSKHGWLFLTKTCFECWKFYIDIFFNLFWHLEQLHSLQPSRAHSTVSWIIHVKYAFVAFIFVCDMFFSLDNLVISRLIIWFSLKVLDHSRVVQWRNQPKHLIAAALFSWMFLYAYITNTGHIYISIFHRFPSITASRPGFLCFTHLKLFVNKATSGENWSHNISYFFVLYLWNKHAKHTKIKP